MKHLFFKKTFLLLIGILMLSLINIYAQNTYLLFKEGTKEKVDGIETLPKRTYQSLKSNNAEIGYTFSGAYVAETEVDSTSYNFLHINGFSKMVQVGAPALPAHNDIIAMPRGATGKIVILEANYYEYEGFMIHPTLEPARDTEGEPGPEFQKDDAIYTKNEFFPQNIVEIVNVGLSRGTGLATTQIRPVQFNPVTGKIRVYPSIKYRLETIGGEESFDYILKENTLHYINLLKRNVINSDMIPDGVSKNEFNSDGSGANNYIIICHQEYLSQANDLAKWKRQLGYSVEVVSQLSWTAAQVNTEVHNRYNAWTPKPDYFVIIGDHTGAYAVPGEIRQDPNYGDNFATDLYVACMDGAGDYVPDMAHGRISVSSSAEATVVVNKIINYEKNPTTTASYYSNALNCAYYQDDDNNDGYADRRFCHTSEDIRDYLQIEQAYTSERIYFTNTTWDRTDLHYNNGYYSDGQLLPAELRDPAFNWNGASSDITSAIDAGKFMVFHRDHGYVGGSGWAEPYYTTTTMEDLANGDKLPVVFSMNCHTGEFQLANCFAEKFLRMENKGAVGVIGAAYYSYSGYNDALSEGMIDAIWSDPGIYADFGTAGNGGSYTIGPGNDIYTMGDVVNQGLYAMVQNFGVNAYTFEIFHYFGDPAMKIWTANPNDNIITATHDATIDCAGSLFSITGSTAGATATLVFNKELIAETTLDGSGDGTLTYSITNPGSTVTLTISKYNHKPYTSDLTVTGTCSFPPAVETYAATSILTSSATLNGEITNDFGSTVTESGFVYSTSSDPVIGGGGVIQIQTSPTVTTGIFDEDISGLSASTIYYFKAYAINENGTSYGNVQNFTTLCGIYTLPFSESFDGAFLPNCWTTQTEGGAIDKWGITTTNNAGGTPNEAYVTWEYISPATSRLITPMLNTVGMTHLNLSFNHYFDDYDVGMTLKIQSSTDGLTWTDESWVQSSGGGNLGPGPINTVISNNLNSPNTYIAFVVDGNLYRFDNWYLDDIEIIQSPPLTYQSCTLTQNSDDVYQGSLEQEIIGIQIEISGIADVLSITQFTLNTTGTTNTADILNARLFYTETTNTFATNNQFGTAVSNPNGTFSITGSLDLLSGVNYFWLTYDLASLATPGNVIDAQCTEIVIGGNTETPSNSNPTGERTIIAAPVLSVSTDVLNATVTQCYDSVTQQFTIENLGSADLDFNILGGAGSSSDATSTQYYSTTDETTNHYFTELPNATDSIYLIITINGDFDLSTEYVDIYVDGSYIGQINPTVNNTDISESFALGGSNVVNWLSDEKIIVTLDNSPGVNTGYGTMLHQVQLSIFGTEWINFSSNSGTINPGASQQIDIEFNAKHLNAGIYNAEVIISSNDPVNTADTIACTFTVQGSPVIVLSGTAFNFGDVFVNGTSTDTLLISNTGCDTLFISNITSSTAEFTVDTTLLNILPGDSAEVIITFAPITLGNFNAILTVFNNDADATINLSGTGIAAPVVSVDPESFNVIFTECNNSLTLPLTLYNTGGGELIWNIEDYIAGSIITTFAGGNQQNGNMFDITASSTITIDSLDINCETTSDYNIRIYYKSGTYVGFENDSTVWTFLGNQTVTGNGVGNPTTITIGGLTILSGETYGLYVTSTSGSLKYTDGSNTYSDENITITAGVGKSYPFGNTFSPRTWNGIIYYSSGTKWITYSSTSGTILSGNSTIIDVQFNASGINSGTYTANIIVNSNDPVNPQLKVPCVLTVDGSPAISLSDTYFNFGAVFQNETSTDILFISNTGCDTLKVSNITSSTGEFTINTTIFDILPGGSEEVVVSFTPTALGNFNGILTVYNNDANSTISLSGTGIGIPEIISSVSSLEFGDVETGTTAELNYTVEGSDLLNDIILNVPTGYEISLTSGSGFASSLTLTQTGGTIVTTYIYVRFAPIVEQAYSGNITHTSTDASQVNVTVTGNGVAPGTPIITKSVPSLDFGDIILNTSSEQQSYSISGINLTSDIVITSPDGFEITLTSGSGFTTSLALPEIGGTVSSTPIYVKFAPISAISYINDITNVSAGATTVNVSVTGNGICESLIVTGPGNQTKCEGETATFTVSVTGTETITYVWKKGTVILSNGGDISGATTNSISIANTESADAGTYTCEVTDACSNTKISEMVLVVLSDVNITANPASLTKCEGEQAQFTVSATGDGLFYQWKKGETNVGTNSSTYTIASVTIADADNYSCVVSGACGDPETSSVAVLTVNAFTVSINSQPQDAIICEGDEVTFTIIATDATSYQWQKNGTAIAGATSDSYTLNSVTTIDAGDYNCIASDACGSVTSNSGTLTVNTSSVAITGHPESASVCEGDEVTFIVMATDATSYQWQKDGTDISGATSDSYTINSVSTSDSGEYTCIVIDACGSVTSDSATLTVKLSTEITQQPVDINANEGEDISLTIVATGTNLTYQWRFEGANIAGADTATYQILSVVVDYAGNYDVVVTGECGEVTSDIAVLSVATTVEKLTEYDINIYPNPSKGIFNVSYNKNIETVEVIIINFEGKVIYQKNHNSGNFVIDLSDKAKGVYLIKCNYRGKSLVSRIVLE